MLYIGEQVGRHDGGMASAAVDIAVDPLEGTNLVATGQGGALTVLAASEKGGLTHAPDTYLEKLAVGPVAAGCVDITRPPAENCHRIAEALRRKVSDITVDHPGPAAPRGPDRGGAGDGRPDQADHRRRRLGRHQLRRPGHRRPRGDGDRRGSRGRDHRRRAALPGRRAPGAVPVPQRRGARARGRGCSATRTRRACTGRRTWRPATTWCSRRPGVTGGDLLQGVRFFGGGARTHSLVMAYQTKQVRFVDTVHMFDRDRPPAVRL